MIRFKEKAGKLIWLPVTASVAISILFIVMSLFGSILMVAFDIDFYEEQYRLLGRPEAIGISEEDLIRVTQELLDYSAGRREALDSRAVIRGVERQVFNEREIAHMVDVKNLFAQAFLARDVSLISLIVIFIVFYVLFGKQIWAGFSKTYIAVCLSTFALLGALSLFAVIDFTLFWDLFHRLTFDNYLWLLDPRTDIMIQMVPEQFFFNTVMRIIVYFVIAILVPAFASATYLVISRRKRVLS